MRDRSSILIARPLALVGLMIACGCAGDEPLDDSGGRPVDSGPGSGPDSGTDPDAPALSRYQLPDPDPIDWRSWDRCTASSQARCGSVNVPLDYTDLTDGRVVPIYVKVIPAVDQANRIGPLFYNPGGPGIAGATGGLLQTNAARLGAAGARFDLVAWNPRGVGNPLAGLAPIDCGDDLNRLPIRMSRPAPDGESERVTARTAAGAYADGCLAAANYQQILPFMSQEVAALDMDYLRRALFGGEQLNYLGVSAGTEIGRIYLGLYGQTVRAMVLDSVVGSAGDITRTSEQQGREATRLLVEFFSWCVANRPIDGDIAGRCTFASQATTAQQIAEAFVSLVSRLDRPAPSDVIQQTDAQAGLELAKLAPGDIYWGIYGRMLFQQNWSGLAAALRAADEGDPETGEVYVRRAAALQQPTGERQVGDRTESRRLELGISDLADLYFGARVRAGGASQTRDNDPYLAISCVSTPPREPSDLWALLAAAQDSDEGFLVDVFETDLYATDDPYPDDPFPWSAAVAAPERVRFFDFAGAAAATEYLPCTERAWPTLATSQNIVYEGDAPILLLNYRLDIATPLADAEAVQRTIGPAAALLTIEGTGHNVTASGVACAVDAIRNYFVDPETAKQADGTRCAWKSDASVAKTYWY